MTLAPSSGQDLLETAYRALAREDWSTAEAYARLYSEKDEANAEVHHLLGAAAVGAGAYYEAARALERACALRDEPSWLSDLGSVLVVCQRWDEAAAAFRRSLELVPHDSRARAGLGHVLCQQRK